jgi:hypothetical protein
MRVVAIIRLFVFTGFVLVGAHSVVAQTSNLYNKGYRQSPTQVPRYTPQSPTVSPYLSLLSRNGSPAGNYYGIVRPLERQQVFNSNQAQQAVTQEQQLARIQTEQQQNFDQPKVKPTGTAGWYQTYGQTPPYQVAGHYYGQWQAPRSQRRAGATSGRH